MGEAIEKQAQTQPAQPRSALGPGPPALSVGGLTPLTTIDYPGELAAVVFCQGCPWRCRYCHNAHLAGRDAAPNLAWADVVRFLTSRRGLLDAVVFSGGEPTAQRGLGAAMRTARALGFKVGLHTAGCYPERLRVVLPLVDWVGFDIKALPERYTELTGVAGSGERAWESLGVLLASGVAHEVRITVHGELLPRAEADWLVDRVRRAGAREIVLQNAKTGAMLDPTLGPNPARWLLEDRQPVFYKGITSRRLAGAE
ncbi:MAG: anaerobic ribonucleoside-triphosphate reductase activating protein [Gammaproteobacteria bacterium]